MIFAVLVDAAPLDVKSGAWVYARGGFDAACATLGLPAPALVVLLGDDTDPADVHRPLVHFPAIVSVGQRALAWFRPDLDVHQAHGYPILYRGRQTLVPVRHPRTGIDPTVDLARLLAPFEAWPGACWYCRSHEIHRYDPEGVGYCTAHERWVGGDLAKRTLFL